MSAVGCNYYCVIFCFKIRIMKVEELRIGNLLFVDNKKYHEDDFEKPFKVYSINKHAVGVEDLRNEFNAYGQKVGFLKPIPLSDEIVYALGFNSKWVKGVFGIATTSEHSDYVFYQECEENGIAYFPKPLKYIHELQNMYYALTGEELTLNEI